MRRRDVLALVGAGALGGCTQLVSSDTGSPTTTTATRTTRATTRTTAETTDATETTETTAETTEPDPEPGIGGVPVARESFDLRRLSHAELPQSGRIARAEKVCNETVEELDDIPDLNTMETDGQRGHMPLRTTRSILELQTCYRETGDERFLRKAESKAQALVDIGIEQDGALFFPYMIDKGGSGVRMEAPWPSAISQGPALSGFLRLADHTGKDRYREAAEKTFESFQSLYRDTPDGGEWIATVEDGYYWLEEYPHDPPTHVLNGFLIGVWGLYEYWLDRGTDESRLLLEAALTTAADHVEEYRVEGEVSWYALDHGYRGNEFYHSIHIHQLGELYKLTGDDRFREVREAFVEDHEPIEIE